MYDKLQASQEQRSTDMRRSVSSHCGIASPVFGWWY